MFEDLFFDDFDDMMVFLATFEEEELQDFDEMEEDECELKI